MTHFVGIGGIGMSALAHALLDQGTPVTGSDLGDSEVIHQLKQRGALIHHEHSRKWISSQTTRIVVSSAIRPNNPEVLAAQELGIPILHRSDLLRELLQERAALLVAGTHGKTTTTAMLAWVLYYAGWDPGFAIGGLWQKISMPHGRQGKGLYFVAEADESDGTFLRYPARAAILTNCGRDHLDHFGTLENLRDTFKKFAAGVPSDGLLWCRDDAALTTFNLPGQSYGQHLDADWRLVECHTVGWKVYFSVACHAKGIYIDGIEIPLPGLHVALNATAVIAMAHRLGIPTYLIKEALASFPGVGRRCHILCHDPVTVIHDYAHHPTEIQTTLRALRNAFDRSRRLMVVFQPHRYSRTKDLLDAFPTAFQDSDSLITTDIYGAFEEPISGYDGASFAAKIEAHYAGKSAFVTRKDLLATLERWVHPSDVVVLMGAGDIEEIAAHVARAVQSQTVS